jgi:aryl-alcohol dehydrogenase-like predicted oxidoreductase
MEYRKLGASGMFVPALTFGTGTFHPTHVDDRNGTTDATQARRIVDICLDHGLNMFDTATSYGSGYSESFLGDAIKGRRDKVILSTKAGMPSGPGPLQVGLSRQNLTESIEKSLKRMHTDYIDVFQLHCFDALTPIEETLSTLGDFVRAGKIRYVGVSNFAGWQLMKSLAFAERHNLPRYVVQQVYYSLIGRDFELDLMPLGLDQGVGAAVWSPLGWGRLTGKLRRGQPLPRESRLQKTHADAPPVEAERFFAVVDCLEDVAAQTGKSIPQVALNWLLRRPTVATVIIGAREEKQILDNLGAVGWSLSEDQVAMLDAASKVYPLYPQWHQRRYGLDRIPSPVPTKVEDWFPAHGKDVY